MTTAPNAAPVGDVRLELDADVVGTRDVAGWVVIAARRERFDGWLELLALLRVAVRNRQV